MKTVPVAELEAHFSTYLEASQTEGPIVITEGGKLIAVLWRPQNKDGLERLLPSRAPRFQALLDRWRKSIRAGEGLTRDTFWEAVEQRHCERAPADER